VTYKRYRNISENSIFFDDTIRYIDIENDISIFSIYRIITSEIWSNPSNTHWLACTALQHIHND